jgi:DHA1 family bicyclomycin/chloramphenicol resistance-like MFS transporter
MGGVSFAVGALASAVGAAAYDGTARPLAANIAAGLVVAAIAYHGLARPR